MNKVTAKFLGGPAHGRVRDVLADEHERPLLHTMTYAVPAPGGGSEHTTYIRYRISHEWVYLHESLPKPERYRVEHHVAGPADQKQRSLIQARQETRIRNHAADHRYRPTRFFHQWDHGRTTLVTWTDALPEAAFTPEAPRG